MVSVYTRNELTVDLSEVEDGSVEVFSLGITISLSEILLLCRLLSSTAAAAAAAPRTR